MSHHDKAINPPASSSLLDVSLSLNKRIVMTVKGRDSVIASGAGILLELPVGLMHVLMAFADTTTARQVFQALELDIELEEFTEIIARFLECNILESARDDEHELGLQQLFSSRPGFDAKMALRIQDWMQQGRIIIIPDALPIDLAESAHHDLHHSTQWVAAENAHDFFHYRKSTIHQIEGLTSALTRCSRIFRSGETKRFIAQISGVDCAGEASVSASWYRPNEYALPHNDSSAREPRSVAFIWYLTKNWRREWGGSLFWCPTGQYINPGFNVLVMFNVMSQNMHLVCPVSASATEKRLTINGFWHRSEGHVQPEMPIPEESIVSPRVLGQPAPTDHERSSLIVL